MVKAQQGTCGCFILLSDALTDTECVLRSVLRSKLRLCNNLYMVTGSLQAGHVTANPTYKQVMYMNNRGHAKPVQVRLASQQCKPSVKAKLTICIPAVVLAFWLFLRTGLISPFPLVPLCVGFTKMLLQGFGPQGTLHLSSCPLCVCRHSCCQHAQPGSERGTNALHIIHLLHELLSNRHRL